MLRPDVCASIAVPIEVGGTVIGVLDLQTSQPDLFTEETLEVARRLAAQIALVIQNVLLRAHERETLAKLRELDQLKSDFLAIANHELRTPIAAVRGFLRTLVLHRQQLSPEEVDEFLTRADRRSEDLARLVDDLLSMSRLEAGPVTLRLEETDLEVLARDTLDLFPDEERARVTLEVTGSRPRVRADTRRLGQILRNLVHNALKFSSPDSPVNVSLAVEDEWLEIEVTDRGVGIPQQELPVIFEAFRQVAGHMTRESDGLGLGLYVVRTLVDAMEGEIRVQSRPGVGSTFAVAVPLSDQSTSSPADRGSNEELLAAGN